MEGLKMQVLYTSSGERPALMTFGELCESFDASKTDYNAEEMGTLLESVGWYTGVHDCGEYLVVNIGKFDQLIQPTAYWR